MSAHEHEKAIGDLTPLIDVAFLILIFFMCLPFRSLDARLESHLPTTKGIHITSDRPPEEMRIEVHILGRDEQMRPWGANRSVPAPTRVLYRFEDGRTVDSTDAVFARIQRLKREAARIGNVEVKGEIKAGARVPHKFIIAVLNRFAEARINDVDFYGTRIPTRNALLARYLPYPDER